MKIDDPAARKSKHLLGQHPHIRDAEQVVKGPLAQMSCPITRSSEAPQSAITCPANDFAILGDDPTDLVAFLEQELAAPNQERPCAHYEASEFHQQSGVPGR